MHDGIRSHQNHQIAVRSSRESWRGRQARWLPSGEGAPVPGALEDGCLDALPAARGVASGLASRHGWMDAQLAWGTRRVGWR